ncbi:hypothetical protein LUZ60_002999 [Juncus effusus]|nr:hypothetical protein LUZ60_002999 [Juncus effusus]
MKLHHFLIHASDLSHNDHSSSSTSSSSHHEIFRNNPWHLSLSPKLLPDSFFFKNFASRPSCRSSKLSSCVVETQSGGTRWNPSPDQIRILEALYKNGMRTPNSNQIERITVELSRYGRIEGKNVFYWFQNHKARERQKQKRSAILSLYGNNNDNEMKDVSHTKEYMEKEKESNMAAGNKRRCRSWSSNGNEEDGIEDGTLELFPLHPEPKHT